MFDKISTALVTLLGSNSRIQSVYDFEATNLDGVPAMTITPSANENDYGTTTENRRIYSFVVRLYVLRGSTTDAERLAEKTMRDLVDSVLDKVDKNHTDFNPDNQTGYTFLFLEAAPSQWGYAGRENEHRVAEIKVRAHFDIDTTLIS